MCPYCDGTPMLLGRLGGYLAFRCRHCGGEWQEEDPEAPVFEFPDQDDEEKEA